MFAKSPENATINKNLQTIGKNILSAAALISVFLTNNNITANALLAKSNAKKAQFSKVFLQKYDIRSFFGLHPSLALESVEKDIVNQIIATIFVSNKPLITLNLLLNVLNGINTDAEIDYRSVINEYAGMKKVALQYEIIGELGSDSDKTFIAQLTCGTEVFTAEGKTKKKAYAFAARKCVIEKQIPISNKRDAITPMTCRYTLDNNRIHDLRSILQILKIKEGLLTFKEIDSAFTHASFANEKKNNQLAVQNSVLREIGAHLLIVSACRLLFSPESTDNLSSKIQEITAGEAVRQATDKKLLPLIRKRSQQNEQGLDGILLDCYKALLAVIILKYNSKRSLDLWDAYNTVISELLENAKQHLFVNYTSRLIEMAQEIGSVVEYQQKEVTVLDDNTCSYVIEATYASDEQVVHVTGRGKSVKSAKNDASKKMIHILLDDQHVDNSSKEIDNTEQETQSNGSEHSTVHFISIPQKESQENEDIQSNLTLQTVIDEQQEKKHSPENFSAHFPPIPQKKSQENRSTSSSSVPVFYTETRKQFKRSREVASYVKICAEGICELCKQPAPFLDLSGRPYLECHHVIWLSKGGLDTVLNAVALCPTCHRKIHVLNDPTDLEILVVAAAKHQKYFQ